MWAFTVTLTLKIANQLFHTTIHPIMMHHRTMFGSKMSGSSEDIFPTNIERHFDPLLYLGTERSNWSNFKEDTLAYDNAPRSQVWLQTDQKFKRYIGETVILMISQPVSSIFPCSPLPARTWQTPGMSIPWCCLPTSSSVCLVFFPLSLCLARWFRLHLMNRRHDQTTAVCVSLQWSGGLRVIWLQAGSWHRLLRW